MWKAGVQRGKRGFGRAIGSWRVTAESAVKPPPSRCYPLLKAVMLGCEGDTVELAVLRRGETRELTLRPTLVAYGSVSGLRSLASQVMNFYPLFFLIVGLFVLGLRLEDRNAWLLALLFAGFICGAPLFEGSINPHLRGLASFYKVTFGSLVPGMFCFFFLTFPASSPIDRRLPRLKSILLSVNTAYSIPLGLACLLAGGSFPYYSLFGWVSKKPLAWPVILFSIGLYSLGFVS